MHPTTYIKFEQCLALLIEECAIEEMIAAGGKIKRITQKDSNHDGRINI